MPLVVHSAANSAEVYWQPRSAWKITPAARPPRARTAAVSASLISSVRRWPAIDQPISRREPMSMTVARYSHESPTGR